MSISEGETIRKDTTRTNRTENPNPSLLSIRAVLPHVAGQTAEALVKMSTGAAENILQLLRGERPAFVVNPEAWDHPRWREGNAGENSLA